MILYDIQKLCIVMHSVQVQQLIKDLEKHRNPERAKNVRNYMKTSGLEFYGVPLPIIRDIGKKHAKHVDPTDFYMFLDGLWEFSVFDTRRAAAEVLLQFIKRSMAEQEVMSLIHAWIDDIDTWALTDPLGWCIGKLLINNSELTTTLKEWGNSDNYWRRRMAIVPYVELCLRGQYRREYGPWILKALTPHLGDSEFFVAKAVGWVLRQLSAHEPDLVRQFINEHRTEMSRVAFREGSRKL
jgi:3-methyladenine DNA glycosylase AlkD